MAGREVRLPDHLGLRFSPCNRDGLLFEGTVPVPLTSREICIERGLLSLESCGANPASRFRWAAVRNGNAQVLERLATTDPSSDIRMEAYERIKNPSQMVSARYVSRITAHFSCDLRHPIKVIQNMTDRAALEYVIKNASLEYFQDLAKERLADLVK